MLEQTNTLPEKATEILGGLTALTEELGGTASLNELPLASIGLSLSRVTTFAELARFLDRYSAEILIPSELPAIIRAHGYAARSEVRELIALDQELNANSRSAAFAQASTRVGRSQLRRLRPLRTERLLQRYWQAVEKEEAYAWHTVVFGTILALYSIPLRSGLLHFTERILDGFIQAASSQLSVTAEQRTQLIAARSGSLVSAVNSLLEGTLQEVP